MPDVVGGTVVWDLDVDSKKLNAGLASASSQVKKTAKTVDSQMSKMGQSITTAFKKAEMGSKIFTGAMVAAGAAATAFAFKSVQASRVQIEAETKLIQLHKENTGATQEQTQSLLDLASATQALGVIGDEAIINGQAQLATFKLSTDAIAELTPAMADMVAQQKGVNATGEDFVNIGNLIGKVMEGQVGALGRYGVSFSDAQEAMLKTGNEMERAATLAEVLAANYGGVNEALRETPQGEMQAAMNTLGDFMELIGNFIDTQLAGIASAFNDWAASMGGPEGIMKNFTENILPQLIDNMPIIIGAIIGGLTPAFVALAAAITPTLLWIGLFIAAGATIGLIVKKVVDSLGGWEKTQEKLNEGLQKVGEIFNRFIRPALDRLWESIQSNLLPALGRLSKAVGPLLTPVLKFLGKLAGAIVVAQIRIFIEILILTADTIANVINWIFDLANAFVSFGQSAGQAFSDFLAKIVEWKDKAIRIFTNFVDGVKNVFSTIGEAIIEGLAPYIWVYQNIIEPISLLILAIIKRIWFEAFELVKAAMMLIFGFLREVWNSIVEFISPVLQTIKQNFELVWNNIKEILERVWNSIRDTAIKVWNIISEKILDPIRKVRDDVVKETESTRNQIQDIWEGIVDFFTGIKDRIVEGISGPFKAAKEKIEGFAQSIRDTAKKIDPYHRESPSLVDNVKSGIGEIIDFYSSLRNVSLPSVASQSAGFQSPFGTANIGETVSSNNSNNQTITVNIGQVNDNQDVEMIGREIAFRSSLA